MAQWKRTRLLIWGFWVRVPAGLSFLLRFILGRGTFRNDINDKCILCKDSDNSQEHVVNECAKTEKLRTKLTKELNDLDNTTKNKTLLDSIFYWYYSKDL